jgi:hypothetical protein
MGIIVAGIWFVLWGLLGLVSVAYSNIVLAILAIVAGILLIAGR